jgi:hypothetical protein
VTDSIQFVIPLGRGYIKATNEQIISAYKQTGSVWRAAKLLGMAGQSVHERLRRLGYRTVGDNWTPEEEQEATRLAGEGVPISEIGWRLNRPYSGVACKLSELGVRHKMGRTKKQPRDGYNQRKTKKLCKKLASDGITLNAFCRRNGLAKTAFANALQRHCPEFWDSYIANHAVLPSKTCPGCDGVFTPLTHRQIACSGRCRSNAASDKRYFGGKRKETIGLADGVCQLCMAKKDKGLSSHHIFGKENDPGNEYLIALCPGCHQLVGILAGRLFVDSPEGWENLINLVMMRRNGAKRKDYAAIHTTVDIDFISPDELPERVEIEVGKPEAVIG